jgi:hypothetical protein
MKSAQVGYDYLMKEDRERGMMTSLTDVSCVLRV